jgi:NADPH:quinone reductase
MSHEAFPCFCDVFFLALNIPRVGDVGTAAIRRSQTDVWFQRSVHCPLLILLYARFVRRNFGIGFDPERTEQVVRLNANLIALPCLVLTFALLFWRHRTFRLASALEDDQTPWGRKVMRAIRFEAFGDPSVLELAEVAVPAIAETTALVRVMAASVNPSDVKNLAGAMKQTTLPRIPGRDFAGVVEAGPAEWIGAAVWGTGGDTGFTRDGTHAEMIAVPMASLRRKPDTLSFDEAASVGVNYIAAWCGLEAAGLHAGETVLLIGAGGGVGGAAAQIARRLGARVISADLRAPHPDAPIHGIAEKLILGAKDLPAEVRAATGGKGADVVFDLVGGVMFRNAVNSLALRGRLIEIAVTGQREVSFDLADFYHNESRLYGVDTLKRDLTALGQSAGSTDAGVCRRRLSRRANCGDLRSWRRPRSLSQGRGWVSGPDRTATAGIERRR